MKKIKKRRYIREIGWNLISALPKAILKAGKYTVDNSEISYNPKTKDVVWKFKKNF